MTLILYNMLTRKKELFRPLKKGSIGLYTCGPTVYNFAHIGNLRTYIFEDILRRVLEIHGYTVKHVMNITDIEDKIIHEANRKNISISELTKPFEKAFLADLNTLSIKKAWKYPRATRHIPEMIHLISSLLKKNHAYQSDGSIYFDISTFKPYGRLSRISKNARIAEMRSNADEYTKQDIQDFVLWKQAKKNEPSWRAPFGTGRPGWHIECSAMAMEYLGSTIDIHAGGVDLMFPHHENEIAQSESITGKQFVRFFTEGEHLLVNGEKMAKSLGNTYTLRSIEEHGYSPLDFRYLTLTVHYRSTLNFTWESLGAAHKARNDLISFVEELIVSKRINTDVVSYAKYSNLFLSAVADDLGVPKALGIMHLFIKQYRKAIKKNSSKAYKIILQFDEILGLNLASVKKPQNKSFPENISILIKEREKFRSENNWGESDRLRDEIEKAGWLVTDTSSGFTVKKRRNI